jgi:hypothetical protein
MDVAEQWDKQKFDIERAPLWAAHVERSWKTVSGLVLGHILRLRAGGFGVVENLQTLCETCDKRMQREDRAAAAAFMAGVA